MRLRHAQSAVVIVVALPLLAAAPTTTGIREQCVDAFARTVGAQAIGKKCGWLDAASSRKLNSAQLDASTCVLAGATPHEKDELIPAEIAKEVGSATNETTNMPCEPPARQFFNAQVSAAPVVEH